MLNGDKHVVSKALYGIPNSSVKMHTTTLVQGRADVAVPQP